MKFSIFILTLFSLLIVACSPKIYLIDRQTILEEEAAGEWPDFQKALLEKEKKQGPTPFIKTENSVEKKRLYQVLNGELTSQADKNKLAK